MIAEYKISLNNNKLSNYDNLLKKFRNWKQFQRDIKLTSLLESKRIQYDLEDIINLPGYFRMENITSDICFWIKSMSFIINGDSVDELKITIETINARGKIIESSVNNGVNIEIKQYIIDGEVKFFYINSFEKKSS